MLALRVAYPGDVKEGARRTEALRALAPIHLDGVGELTAGEIAKVHNDPTQPTSSWVRGLLLTRVDQDFATVFVEWLKTSKLKAEDALFIFSVGGGNLAGKDRLSAGDD